MMYIYDFKPFYDVRKMQNSAMMIFLTTNEENTHTACLIVIKCFLQVLTSVLKNSKAN